MRVCENITYSAAKDAANKKIQKLRIDWNLAPDLIFKEVADQFRTFGALETYLQYPLSFIQSNPTVPVRPKNFSSLVAK